MKTILVATDFSERSDRALRRATLLAKQFEASISLLHVIDDDQPRRIVEAERDVALELLREMQMTVTAHDSVPCEIRLVLGAPFAGIAQAMQEMAPDLLVIGPHRRQALKDVFIGTTAERTLRSGGYPVLMANGPPLGPYRHILIATDFSEAAHRAAERFFALELGRGAKVSLLHVYDVPLHHTMMGREELQTSFDKQSITAMQALSDFAKSLGDGRMHQIARPQASTPALDVLEAAKTAGVDLVVVGTHGKTGLTKYLLGSVAEELLRIADRDVLAVPPIAFQKS
jgi:nucleotide-binding universal stress UspA family protein